MTNIPPDSPVDADEPLTAETLRQALKVQTEMVEVVRGLSPSVRRMKQILGGVVAGLVAAAGVGVIAYRAGQEALDAGQTAKRAIAQVEVQREEARMSACQVRNASSKAIRQAIDLTNQTGYDRQNQLIKNILAVTPATSPSRPFLEAQLAIPIVDVTPPETEVDSDCNLDGIVDETDYPAGA